MKNLSVGIDVGGTFTKIGLVSPNGDVIHSLQIPTEPSKGPAHFIRRAAAIVKAWDFGSVGLGLAGGVDAKTGTLLFVPNLKGWTGFSFKKAFSKSFGVPVVVENDANAAVWGGYVVALKKKPLTVVGVTLGTGVGGGLIINGRPHRGATGWPGRRPSDRLTVPWARLPRCLEAYAGIRDCPPARIHAPSSSPLTEVGRRCRVGWRRRALKVQTSEPASDRASPA